MSNALKTEEQAPNETRAEGSQPEESREPDQQGAPEGGEVERESSIPPVRVDNRRNAIYEKARAARDREMGIEGEPGAEDRSDAGEARQQQQPDADEAPRETRRRRLKVNGQDFELSDEEVTALAQKALAAGDVLESAKSIRAQLQQRLEALQAAEAANQSGRPQQDSQAKPKPSEDTKPDDDELDDIIDSIQVGNPDEAKAALAKYGDRLERRILDRFGDLDQRIADTTRTIAETQDRQRQTQTVLEQFEAENSDLANDGMVVQAIAYTTVQRMREQMQGLGVQEETIETLKRNNGWDDQTAVGYAYRHLQSRGYRLPDQASVLKESVNAVRERFGLKAPQRENNPTPALEQREARKQAMAPQPRRANIAPGPAPEPNITDSRRDAVRQMKMARRGR